MLLKSATKQLILCSLNTVVKFSKWFLPMLVITRTSRSLWLTLTNSITQHEK
jgi:hypothetical protein